MKRFLFSLILLGFVIGVVAQPFTPGNLVALRVNDGTARAGSNPACPVFLIEYNLAGGVIQTKNILSVTAGNRLTIPLNSIFDGLLTLNPDSRFLSFGGFDAAVGTNVPSQTSPAVMNRVIGRTDVFGITTLTTKINNAFDGSAGLDGSIRSAITTDGVNFWVAGQTQSANGAIRHATHTVTGSTQITASDNNDSRAIGIFEGQLYASSASATGTSKRGINRVGTGVTTAGGQLYTLLTGTTLTAPSQFIMFDVNKYVPGPDLMYVADSDPTTGGIWKFSNDGLVGWQPNGRLTGAANGLTGFRNCDGTVTLFVSQAIATNNNIYKVTDDATLFVPIIGSGTAFSTTGTLFVAGIANAGYRGLAITAQSSTVINTPGQTIGTFAYDNIIIKNGGSATLTGNVTVRQKVIVENGGILNMADKVISSEPGFASTSFELQAGGTIKIGHAQGISAASATGNVQTCIRVFPENANYEYNATIPQIVGDGLPASISFGSTLKINNTSGIATSGVNFSNDIYIAGTLDLTLGKMTVVSGVLAVADGGVAINHSLNSFVTGLVTKYGDDNFIFPIGVGSIYAPLGMLNAGPGDPSDAFTGQYFRSNPQSDYGPAVGAGLDHVSYVEYWTLSDQGFSPSAKNISLNVHAESFCKVLASTYVARWNGSVWNKINGTSALSGMSGAYQLGTLTTTVPSSGLVEGVSDAFTLSTDLIQSINPLPIDLIAFDAAKISSTKSSVTWELAACCRADARFEVQKATGDRQFRSIGSIGGSETNRFYQFGDNDLKAGVNYYRLKMIDADGTVTYSRTVAIMNGTEGLLLTSMKPTIARDNATLTIASSASQKITIAVTAANGVVVLQQTYMVTPGNSNVQLNLDKLAAGIYQVHALNSDGKSNLIRFIKE